MHQEQVTSILIPRDQVQNLFVNYNLNYAINQVMLNKVLFSLASGAFIMITLLTLMDEVFAFTAFRIVLAFYSLVMIAVEISQFSSFCSETVLQMTGRVFAVLGYLTFIEAAYLYGTFNKGNIYIVGSFFISASALLKLLAMIISTSLKTIYMKRFTYIRIASMAGVGIFFFLTSALEGLQDKSFSWMLVMVAKASNVTAAVLHIVAAYNLHKEADYIRLKEVEFLESSGELSFL